MAVNDGYLRLVPSDTDRDDARLYDPTEADEGGATHDVVVAEIAVGADLQIAVADRIAQVAEGVAATASQAAATLFNASAGDTASATDTSGALTDSVANVAEATNAADVPAAQAVFGSTADDSLNAADAGQASTVSGGALSDTLAATDNAVSAVDASRGLDDSLVVDDTAGASSHLNADTAEALAVSDSAIGWEANDAVVSEAITLADASDATVVSGQVSNPPFPAGLGVGWNTQRRKRSRQAFVFAGDQREKVSTLDAQSANAIIVAGTQDEVIASDESNASLHARGNARDLLRASDAFRAQADYASSIREQTTAADSQDCEVIRAIRFTPPKKWTPEQDDEDLEDVLLLLGAFR